MLEPQSQPEALSDAEVLASIAGEICAVCGGRKLAARPFCATDWYALPVAGRLGLSPQLTPDAFRAWLRHLQLNPQRRRLISNTSAELPFRSWAEMESAGYKFHGRTQCKSSRCGAEVLLVRRPSGGLLALDEPRLQPHELTCADPDWRARRKQRIQERRQQRRAQTSAHRRRS